MSLQIRIGGLHLRYRDSRWCISLIVFAFIALTVLSVWKLDAQVAARAKQPDYLEHLQHQYYHDSEMARHVALDKARHHVWTQQEAQQHLIATRLKIETRFIAACESKGRGVDRYAEVTRRHLLIYTQLKWRYRSLKKSGQWTIDDSSGDQRFLPPIPCVTGRTAPIFYATMHATPPARSSQSARKHQLTNSSQSEFVDTSIVHPETDPRVVDRNPWRMDDEFVAESKPHYGLSPRSAKEIDLIY